MFWRDPIFISAAELQYVVASNLTSCNISRKTFGEVVKDAKSTYRQVYKFDIIEIFLLLPNQGLILELFPMRIIP